MYIRDNATPQHPNRTGHTSPLHAHMSSPIPGVSQGYHHWGVRALYHGQHALVSSICNQEHDLAFPAYPFYISVGNVYTCLTMI